MTAIDLFSPADAPSAPKKATPMMAQYLAVKAQNPDCLLFYRMGDFYEMFFEDAVNASKALDIALTRRGQHEGQDIPMCGVPVHSHTSYVARLIRAGFRVAICEQTETPEEAKKRGGKALVNRQVTRIITSGTLTEDTLLDARSHNFLLALVPQGAEEVALAWCDLSTNHFMVEMQPRRMLGAALARLCPREIVLPQPLADKADIRNALQECGAAFMPLPAPRFDAANCRARLLGFFNIANTDAWGNFSVGEVTAAGALVDYITLTQLDAKPALRPPMRAISHNRLEIDAATRRNLELTQTVTGQAQGSLLHTIDRTITAAGARLLQARLATPLTQPDEINARLESIAWALNNPAFCTQAQAALKAAPDLERALARLALNRASPRDLAALKQSLMAAETVHFSLRNLPAELAHHAPHLTGYQPLIALLAQALAADLPLLARDGGFIATGYHEELDRQRSLRDESRRLIAALQAQYSADTGINTLKIKHNNIIGYHVEVTSAQAERLLQEPLNQRFYHRQTMAGAMRFSTTELNQLEREIAQAADRALAIELELFETLRQQVLHQQGALALTAVALATFDVTLALADLAVSEHWTRPVVDASNALSITQGRHPVVEAAMKARADAPFVANDCNLADAQRLWLLTGPNMAGKSTFLRQNALIVLLAQMGAYVPAAAAHIGVVDRLFSRVGAADDLARGRSTFMVEMVETATILNLATDKSLVILDEIGRGTATHDGLSIAWSVVEYLHNVTRCRGLFATHYHELTALTATLPALYCATLAVQEWKGEVVFLHTVKAGSADRSYGLHVAALAGLPAAVMARAAQLLHNFEAEKQSFTPPPQLAEAANPFTPKAEDPVHTALKAINPDSLTPREALDQLYHLKTIL